MQGKVARLAPHRHFVRVVDTLKRQFSAIRVLLRFSEMLTTLCRAFANDAIEVFVCNVTVVSYNAFFVDVCHRTFGLKGVRVYVRTEVRDTPDRIENCIIFSFIGLQI